MNIITRSVLFAATFAAFCGCAKNVEYAPKIADGATVAAVGFAQDSTVDAASYRADAMNLLKDFNPELAKFFEDAGLDKAEGKWSAFSMIGLPETDEEGDLKTPPSLVLAVAFDHDLAKIISALKELAKDEKDVVFSQERIADVDCWIINGDEDMAKYGVDICVASLSGKLLIVTSNKGAMADQIALYRDGKGESAKLPSSRFAKNDALRIVIPELGKLVAKAEEAEPGSLAMANEMIPDGEAVIRGLASLELAISSKSGGDYEISFVLDTASPEHAANLGALANGALVPFKAQLKKAVEASPDDAQAAHVYPILNSIKVVSEGNRFVATALIDAATIKWYEEQANAECEGCEADDDVDTEADVDDDDDDE